MSEKWQTHDAGYFTLELPADWRVDRAETGSLFVQDSRREIAMTLLAVSRGTKTTGISTGKVRRAAVPALRPVAPMEAQLELQKWIDGQSHVQVRQAPRLVSGAVNPTATTEGLESLRAGLPWYRRLIRSRPLMLWRYWAVLNPHLLVLISCNGKPAAVERVRRTMDRVVASIRLPLRDILLGRHFTEMVVSLARSYFPRTAVAVIDDVHLQFGTQHLSLAELHERYLSQPENLPTHVRAFLTAAQEEMPASALAASWAHARRDVLPTLLTRTALNNAQGRVAHEEWINGLFIAYVMEDSGGGVAELLGGQRIITRDDVLRWNITQEELHEQALENLVLYSHEHAMQGQKSLGYSMLSLATPDRHNAARILLPELYQKLREHLGRTFYAAVPTRDLLIAFAADDVEVLSRVRQQIAADFSRSSEGLSPKLFLVTPDGIAGDPENAEEL